MTDTERDEATPLPHQRPPSGGAMTEATGSLTPDETDEAFVPAELRAMVRPEIAQATTVGARERNAAETPAADRPGSLDDQPLETVAPNARDGGYGSEHGLAANDPAYDFDERPRRDPLAPRRGGETSLGGDEAHDPEDEHF